MSIYTRVTVTQGATTVARNVPIQMDSASEMISMYYGGHPYDVFEVYIPYYPDYTAARGDLLTDQVNNDPLITPTALAKYRVVGNPEQFPDGHQELRVNRFAGGQS